MPEECSKILEDAYRKARGQLDKPFVSNAMEQSKLKFIMTCPRNRAGARFILACALAKVHKRELDIRKPFTHFQGQEKEGSYSGRQYDEWHIEKFITKYKLPCSQTTAFLTPGFRTKQVVLTREVDLGGRPAQLYTDILDVLHAIQRGKLSAIHALRESIRLLIIMRETRKKRLAELLSELGGEAGALPLSCEDIVTLVQQHLSCKNSSRLPVLIVAAAYKTAATHLQKQVLRLEQHNAADKQTGALGDVEITLLTDDKVVTTYEMKSKPVTIGDIDIAMQKIAGRGVQNYIFITTDSINADVREYATQQYAPLGGTEIAILGCVDFLRHFLHLFHWIRTEFLNHYQDLVLAEPESGVSQPLKEAFISLRKAAEAGYDA